MVMTENRGVAVVALLGRDVAPPCFIKRAEHARTTKCGDVFRGITERVENLVRMLAERRDRQIGPGRIVPEFDRAADMPMTGVVDHHHLAGTRVRMSERVA